MQQFGFASMLLVRQRSVWAFPEDTTARREGPIRQVMMDGSSINLSASRQVQSLGLDRRGEDIRIVGKGVQADWYCNSDDDNHNHNNNNKTNY